MQGTHKALQHAPNTLQSAKQPEAKSDALIEGHLAKDVWQRDGLDWQTRQVAHSVSGLMGQPSYTHGPLLIRA